jgi:hypothetical protein
LITFISQPIRTTLSAFSAYAYGVAVRMAIPCLNLPAFKKGNVEIGFESADNWNYSVSVFTLLLG